MTSKEATTRRGHDAGALVAEIQASVEKFLAKLVRELDDPRLLSEFSENLSQKLAEVEQGDYTYFLVRIRNSWRANLTHRESEVAFLVAQGHPYKYVAQRLGMRRSTVAAHLRHIYEKLSVQSRGELTRLITPLS